MKGREPLRRCLVTCGFLGEFPLMPGTVGSAGILAIAYLISLSGLARVPLSLLFLGLGLISALVNLALGRWAIGFYGREDPSQVVIDEAAGMLISLAWFVEVDSPGLAWIGAFLIFRTLDILKPLGIGKVERLGGGVGILLDDVLAGVYTNVLVHLALVYMT